MAWELITFFARFATVLWQNNMWRVIDENDRSRVSKALESTKDFIINNYSNKSWFKEMNYEVILSNIFNGSLNVVIIEETYLFIFDVSKPWFSDNVMLNELFLLNIGGDAKFSDAVEGMRSIAKAFDASSISVGTALTINDEALARLYKRNGFDVACTQLHGRV